MASFVILGSIRGNSSQEIMNNPTDQENHLKVVYEQINGHDDDKNMNILLSVLYLSFLLIAVIVSVYSNNRMRRNEGRIRRRMEKRENLIYLRKDDRPPSYKKIFFSDNPPTYNEIINFGPDHYYEA